MFTAKDLKEIVNSIPDDTPIILQSDDEGNSYRYMNGIEFFPSGEKSNYYDENDNECWRQEDLDSEEIDPKEKGFVLCAVAY
jgi:hypothetical protein